MDENNWKYVFSMTSGLVWLFLQILFCRTLKKSLENSSPKMERSFLKPPPVSGLATPAPIFFPAAGEGRKRWGGSQKTCTPSQNQNLTPHPGLGHGHLPGTPPVLCVLCDAKYSHTGSPCLSLFIRSKGSFTQLLDSPLKEPNMYYYCF